MSTQDDEIKNNALTTPILEVKGEAEGDDEKEPVDRRVPRVPAISDEATVSQQFDQQLQINNNNDNDNDIVDNNANIDQDNSNASSNMESLYRTMQQLVVLISSLQYENTSTNAYRSISHYSIIPTELQQIYDTIIQQTNIIYNTVTKYTLMQQLVVATGSSSSSNTTSTSDGSDVAILSIVQDLVHACRILVACTMTIFNNNNNNNNTSTSTSNTASISSNTTSLGCCKAVCVHTKKAIRNIITSVLQLFKLFIPHHLETDDTTTTNMQIDPAQCTGIVWESCQYIITYKKLPLGNRNAIRRDLLTYKLDCCDTIQEFQVLYDQSYQYYNNTNEKDKDDDDDDNNDDIDIDELYNPNELEIIQPCINILKCSRGTINIVLTVIDMIGMSISTPQPSQLEQSEKSNDNHINNTIAITTKLKLHWITQLYDLICIVGYGVTDFGAVLYPPLPLAEQGSNSVLVQTELKKQSNAIQNVLQYMIANIIPMYDIGTSNKELIQTIQSACSTRTNEVFNAISQQSKGVNFI
jgi:hypothetical protein